MPCKRKNCPAPEVELVTTKWPLPVAGGFDTAVQFGLPRLKVDRKVNPTALVGHLKITFPPERSIVSRGGTKRLKIVPLPELPP